MSRLPLIQRAEATAGILKQINFQGKVVNKTAGTNITNGSYSFTFTIYDAASGGTSLWTETKSLTVTNGIFQTLLGDTAALPGTIDFNTQELYLGINFNSDGEMSPRVRFAAVPYAFNAEKVAGLTVTNTTGSLTIPNATDVVFSGSYDVSFTLTGNTTLTLPTTGTLVTLAGTEELTNKTIGSTGLVFSGATNDLTTVSNQHLAIMPNGTGNVGIGTTAPEALLTIADNVQLGITDATRYIYFDNGTATNAGIRYDSSTDKMQFSHDGSTWSDMGSGTGSIPNFDEVYAESITDGNLTMEIDNAGGLTFDLTTGDFMIGSTSTFATFGNSGYLQVDNVRLDGNTISSLSSGGIAMSPLAGEDVSISLSGSGDLIVNTNDFFVDTSSGNVGIGTNTPGAKFEIVGSGSAEDMRVLNDGAQIGFNFETYGPNVWSHGMFGAMRARGTKNSPSVPLSGDGLFAIQVGGYVPGIGMQGDNAARLTFQSEGTWTGSSTAGKVVFSVNDGSSEWNGAAFKGLVLSGANKTVLVNTETDLSSAFGVKTASSGDIGIVVRGDNSQSANLQVWQDSSGNQLAAIGPNGEIIGGTATTSDLTLKTTSGVGATGADMHFLVGNNGGTEAMTILNNGNVGISTAAPEVALTVGGDIQLGITDATRSIYFDNGTAGNAGLRYNASTDKMQFSHDGSTWSDMGSGGGTTYTFTNGLTESGGTAKLGGGLTENTIITQDNAESLTFANSGTANTIFNLSSTGDFVVNDGVSDLLKLNDDGTIDITSAATTADAIDITLANLTEGAAIDLNINALTSGDGLRVVSTSTALTSGSLIDLFWNPSGSTEIFSTGDIFKIDLGQYANPANLFALYNNAAKLFSVSQTKITSAVPHEFTAAGDVAIAYDLVLTNQTASLIESYGPLTISSGESFENNNLTLRAYGTGSIVVAGSGLMLETGENFVLDSNDSADSYIEHNNAGNYLSFFVDGTEEVRFLNTSSIHTNNDITTGFDFDIAETYPTFDETLKPGDIVAISATNSADIPAVVEKANVKNAAGIIGIVSTSPAYSMGTGSFAGEYCAEVIATGVDAMMEKERAKLLMLEMNAQTASAAATASEAAALAEQDKLIRSSIEEVLVSKRAKAQTCLAAKQVLVTLAGRIPLSVSMENGPIMPGDQLALSSVPGVAAKATRAGTVVGKALESFTGNTDHNKIMVFANLSYYPGNNGTVLGASTNVSLDSGTVPNGIMNYQADALVVSGDMSVTKTLFANDIYAAGSVSTGVIQIDGVNGSIASRNGDLYVQPGDVMGNVNVFNGLLLLTPDGGIISQSDIQAHRIKAEQVVVLGAGTDGASIGSGVVPKGSTAAVISNSMVDAMSKIFLTPTSATGGQSLVVENKIDGAFSVSIDHSHASDITFDYWVVGVEQ